MKLKYTGPFEAEIPALRLTVKPGATFEAPAKVAASLVDQGIATRVAPPRRRTPAKPKTQTKAGE